MRLHLLDNNDYIQSEIVQQFTGFLSQIISGERSIFCEYVPKKDKQNKFAIALFREGLEQYKWNGKSFFQTQQVIGQFSKKLSDAMNAQDENLILQAALLILDWGQVYRGCIDWLLMHSQDQQLGKAINDSSKVIDGTLVIPPSDFTSLFDRDGQYRCNSGTTKIFALFSRKSIIYDGRVACAIGMLVHDFLIENQIAYIPTQLNFLMDAGQRNTSKYTSAAYTFASKADTVNSLFNQAVSNLKINLILQKVVDDSKSTILGFTEVHQKMRAVEASMFMIGYKVNFERYKRTGKFLI